MDHGNVTRVEGIVIAQKIAKFIGAVGEEVFLLSTFIVPLDAFTPCIRKISIAVCIYNIVGAKEGGTVILDPIRPWIMETKLYDTLRIKIWAIGIISIGIDC